MDYTRRPGIFGLKPTKTYLDLSKAYNSEKHLHTRTDNILASIVEKRVVRTKYVLYHLNLMKNRLLHLCR